MFEKSSYKISDNFFYGLVAGVVIIGIATIYTGYSYFASSVTKNQENIQEIIIIPENKIQNFPLALNS